MAYAWYVTVILTIGNVCAFIDRLIVGVLTPAIQADLGLSDTQAGLLQGLAFALCYTLFGLPIGWLADRGNRKRVLAIGMSVFSAATAACGLASSFLPLFLTRIGVGIGEATMNPCATSLFGDYFPDRSRPRAFGLYGIAPAVGTILSFTGAGFLLAFLQSGAGLPLPLFGVLKPWQSTFLLVGTAGLVPALLVFLTVREPVRERPRENSGGREGVALTTFVKANRATLLHHYLGIALVMVPVYAYANWLPTFFFRSYGWAPVKFSVTYGLPGGVMGIVGSISAGYLATFLKRRGDVAGTFKACAIGCTLSAIGNIVTPLMPTAEWAFGIFLFTGAFNNYTTVLGFSAIAEFVPNALRARITAGFLVCTGLISSSLGPLLVGITADAMKGNPLGIGYGLCGISALLAFPGALLVITGIKPFRASLSRRGGGTDGTSEDPTRLPANLRDPTFTI